MDAARPRHGDQHRHLERGDRERDQLNRIAAPALAALGVAVAIPIPLAQLDFAGVVNVFGIQSGGSPRALVVIAAAGGVLTSAVLVTALAGAVLAARGARPARAVLLTAAVAGFVTALPIWLPAGVVIGAAALLAGHGLTSVGPRSHAGAFGHDIGSPAS